ncbi:MAG: hypothetical protein ACREF4_13525, partial [Gammaproteobacteria bacterium]
MRWSPHNESIHVTALTANARSTLCLDGEGRIFELDRAGRLLADTLWPGTHAIALRLGAELLVADESGSSDLSMGWSSIGAFRWRRAG